MTTFIGVKSYHCLALLCTSFNQALGTGVLPGIQITLCADSMLSLVLAIKLRQHESSMSQFIAFGLFVIFVISSFLIIFAVNTLSNVNQRSQDYIFNYRYRIFTNIVNVNAACHKYVAKSLRPLRFEIGQTYRLERIAKLTIADFLISGVVNLLILLQVTF